jgi:hypothetical protein
MAAPFGPLERCRAQRFCRQTQNVVQSTHVHFPQVRRETVERIDIRPYQPRSHTNLPFGQWDQTFADSPMTQRLPLPCSTGYCIMLTFWQSKARAIDYATSAVPDQLRHDRLQRRRASPTECGRHRNNTTTRCIKSEVPMPAETVSIPKCR